MKKFLLGSMMLAGSIVPALACIGPAPTYRYYIYNIDSESSWGARRDAALAAEWSRLLGTEITSEDFVMLTYLSADNIDKCDYSKIVSKSREGKHYDVINYLKLLLDTNKELMFSYDSWDYPSKEEIAKHESNLRRYQSMAKSYNGKRLAGQYRLMQMRLAFALKDWTECERLWKSCPKDGSVFSDMMRNLYAGVLLRTGKKDDAYAIYSAMGDDESASWCARKNGSLTVIKELFGIDPNSPTFAYLLREFCNNTQETVDALSDIRSGDGNEAVQEMLDFIGAQKINANSAASFVAFAKAAAADKRVKNPRMWLNAAALVSYYYEDYKEAQSLLAEAEKSAGNESDDQNTRMISMFLDVRNTDDAARLAAKAPEYLKWLLSLSADSNYRDRMIDRLVYTELAPRFKDSGRIHDLFAARRVCNSKLMQPSAEGAEYCSDYFHLLDSEPVADVIAWKDYVVGKSATDGWKEIISVGATEEQYLNDIIGTRLMRQGKWAEARKYLKPVSISFLEEQGIAPYAAVRDFKSTAWLSPREKAAEYQKPKLSRNAKLDFCNYMILLESAPANEKNLTQLASAYYNASRSGKCWWLTDYGWSSYPEATAEGDVDFAALANKTLDRAMRVSKKKEQGPMLYAKAYISPGTSELFVYNWSSDKYKLNTEVPAYDAYTALSRYVRSSAARSREIPRCDVLKQFISLSKGE